MKQRILAVLAAVALAATAAAQDSRHITLAYNYDADDSTRFYCVSLGRAGSQTGGTVRGKDYQAPLKVKTVGGADDEIVSNSASSGALREIGVGDLFVLVRNGVRTEYLVLTKADDDTITIDESVDISSGSFYFWRDVQCDDATDFGSIPVGDLDAFQLTVQVAQISVDAGGLDVAIECRQANGPWLDIETVNVTTGGSGTDNFLTRVFNAETWAFCRVGVAVSDDDATDTGGDAEQVNIFVSGKGLVQ